MKYEYSIITPCYNSEYTLHRTFASLKNQNSKEFEWIVIDDKSTDNTNNLINKIKNESQFDIKHIKLKRNKMVIWCYHLGIRVAQGKYIILLDHDDQLVPNALTILSETWLKINNKTDANKIAGIMTPCIDLNGNIIGDNFDNLKKTYDNFFEVRWRNNIKGEKLFCYKAKILKGNNFPLIDKYVPESIVLYKISENFKTWYLNIPLRIYDFPNGSGEHISYWVFEKYPKGFRYFNKYIINSRGSQVYKFRKQILSSIILYCKLSQMLNYNFNDSLKQINNRNMKMLIVLLWPIVFGFTMFKKKLKIENMS